MKDRIIIDADRPLAKIDRNIFGHFCEHAFGNIYGGFYDPESPFADENGIRQDVVAALKQVKTPLLRYPGGNFVSNYHWMDGIGPKENRPKVFEYAWKTEEPNQFGTAEFIELCRQVGAEALICVNMGSGTVEEAMHWVEYCNGTGDTYYANLRRSHGYEEPFGVKYWGLGNEMYGPWQMENLSAKDYAEKAYQFAKAMRWIDPSIKLIAVGFEKDVEWDFEVCKRLGKIIDYVSAHHYSTIWGPFKADNYDHMIMAPKFMEAQTRMSAAAITAGMNYDENRVKVAWDEWNMFGWVGEDVNEEKTYNLLDALYSMLVMNMFIRNADTITLANYSTFVNINGALSVKKDGILRRSQFCAFDVLGNNTGESVCEVTNRSPKLHLPLPVGGKFGRPFRDDNLLNYTVVQGEQYLDIPTVDVAASVDADGTTYISMVNVDRENARTVELDVRGLKNFACVKAQEIYSDDINDANTWEEPEKVIARDAQIPAVENGFVTVEMKPHSALVLVLKGELEA